MRRISSLWQIFVSILNEPSLFSFVIFCNGKYTCCLKYLAASLSTFKTTCLSLFSVNQIFTLWSKKVFKFLGGVKYSSSNSIFLIFSNLNFIIKSLLSTWATRYQNPSKKTIFKGQTLYSPSFSGFL